MKYREISTINRDYFGYEVLSRVLDITTASARVTANRYVKQGLLLRAKRNLYIFRDRLQYFESSQKFTLANLILVPSYISLMTALDYYEITTQMQRDFIESVALKRTREVVLDKITFNYTLIDSRLYFGFRKDKEYFIATPEKALLDAVYLKSFGRYAFDWSVLDRNKLDLKVIKKAIKKFPPRTQNLLEQNGYL
jgi:predicted transcriptional regulator of viral defense system